jgi:hypothetical protein
MKLDIDWDKDDRKKCYDVNKYLTHINGCKGSGDQSCPCGMASVRYNLEQLLDACEDAFASDDPQEPK